MSERSAGCFAVVLEEQNITQATVALKVKDAIAEKPKTDPQSGSPQVPALPRRKACSTARVRDSLVSNARRFPNKREFPVECRLQAQQKRQRPLGLDRS